MITLPFIDVMTEGFRTFTYQTSEFLDKDRTAWLIMIGMALIVLRLLIKLIKIKTGRREHSRYWIYSDLSSQDPRMKQLFRRGWSYHLPKLSVILATLPFWLALANPVLPQVEIRKGEEARQIKFQVDFSGSMVPGAEEGPFAKVKNIILKVLEKSEQSNDQFSVDIFADNVHVISSFNKDKKSLRFALENFDVSQYGEDGTRIDLAIDAAVEFFKRNGDKNIKRKIVVILSDADSSNDPTEAIEKAKKAGVHIYLIAINVTGNISATEMVEMVEAAGGIYIRAENETAVEEAMAQIDNIERATLLSDTHSYNIPIFEPFALLAFILFTAALAVLMSPWFRDFP